MKIHRCQPALMFWVRAQAVSDQIQSFHKQSFEPACVPAGFHSHTHLLACQCTVEGFRVLAMQQSFLLELSGVGIHRSNLLKLGVEIYSYNDHRSAPFSPSLLVGFSTTNSTRASEPTLSWNQLHSQPSRKLSWGGGSLGS